MYKLYAYLKKIDLLVTNKEMKIMLYIYDVAHVMYPMYFCYNF